MHGRQHVRIYTIRKNDSPVSLLSWKNWRDLHFWNLASAGRRKTPNADRKHQVRSNSISHRIYLYSWLQIFTVHCKVILNNNYYYYMLVRGWQIFLTSRVKNYPIFRLLRAIKLSKVYYYIYTQHKCITKQLVHLNWWQFIDIEFL